MDIALLVRIRQSSKCGSVRNDEYSTYTDLGSGAVPSASMKAPSKWEKMLFISSWKLFLFSIYLHFCLDFLGMGKKTASSERKEQFQNLWCHNLVNKQLKCSYIPISHEVKTTNSMGTCHNIFLILTTLNLKFLFFFLSWLTDDL